MEYILITDRVRQAHDDIINGLSDTDEGLTLLPGAIEAAIATFSATVPNYDENQAELDRIALWAGIVATVSDIFKFPHIGSALDIFGASLSTG